MRRRFVKRHFVKKPLVNQQIRAPRVRLVDEKGEQLGVMVTQRAIALAQEKGLDLVQVTEKVEPPVCKLGEYGKFLYQKQKKEKTSQKKTSGEIKGIRLSFAISEHDLGVRARQAEKFLNKGYKVRLEMKLRGRQRALQNFARNKVGKFLDALGESTPYKIERELRSQPRGLTMIISKKQ